MSASPQGPFPWFGPDSRAAPIWTELSLTVDCDPGLDDALALLALAELVRRGTARVSAVTAVAGNGPVELTARNAAFVVARSALRGTPVRAGGGDAPTALRHGPDGLGGLTVAGEEVAERWSEGGVLELARRIGHAPGTILALGPLTNVASALALARPPRARIVVMGGSLGDEAEFNFTHDARAAALVLESGLDVTVVPIDVTRRVGLAPAAVAALGRDAANPLVGPLLAACLGRGAGGPARFHDAVALIALVHPELTRAVRGRVTLTGGRVAVVPDPDGPCQVIATIDVGAGVRRLTELWLASPP